METKGERCFYLNSAKDHSSSTHKVLLASGVASYIADVTFGYHQRPFVGKSPTRGSRAVVSSQPQQEQSVGEEAGAGAEEQQQQLPTM